MPWKDTSAMDERVAFVTAYLTGDHAMTELCEAYGISRKSGYKWMARYRSGGWPALADASRAPHHPGHAMADDTRAALIALRGRYPYWGPKKLRARLLVERPGLSVPAPSTIGDLLRREGLSAPRKRKRSASPSTQPLRHAAAPNDVWCIDFKGWFRTGDGTRCDPLTVTDARTRKVLECHIVKPGTAAVKARMDALFEVYGMPLSIRSDNGPPFASTGAAGLSRLGVHWLKLGIALERIQPGHPEQNGRHERMHATLKRETLGPACATPAEQQARFDAWRRAFNAERPHEALGLTPPDAHYEPSPRRFTGQPQEPKYPDDAATRRVRSRGTIKWGGREIYVSEALAGETVAAIETEAGDWRIRFASVDLGLIDRKRTKLKPFPSPRSGRREQERNQKSVTHLSGQ